MSGLRLFGPRHRPIMWAVLGTLALTILLVWGILEMLQAARTHDASVKSSETATGWARHLAEHTPDLDTIFATGTVREDQLPALEMAQTYGGVTAFALFSRDGQQIVDRGSTFQNGVRAEELSLVTEVANTAKLRTITTVENDDGGGQRANSSVYVPMISPPGDVLGVVVLKTTSALATTSISSFTGMATLAIPLICAFAFLLPMLTMIHMTRRARIREMQLNHLSRRDSLTGLLNRTGISAKAQPLFDRRSDPSEQVGILLIDLDNFKAINELFDPAVADSYLCRTADRLLDLIGDAGQVGRMNGDEFIVLLPSITREGLRRYTAQVQSVIGAPVMIGGQLTMCTASVGMHLSPLGEAFDRALHSADLAINNAKRVGHAQVMEYVDALDQETSRTNQIEREIRRANLEETLEVHFQPFVDARTGLVVGFEALSRLRDKKGNIIGPDEFIPVAESTGLIHELGLVTLRKALRVAKKWPAPIYVSVNLSAVQFQREDLSDQIISVLDRVGLPPERLELELTESLLLGDEHGVSTKLSRLRNAGVRIAMDDFGTGYSSLGYLWKFKFDKLKIDRSFLLGHDFDQSRFYHIIETIILLGHKLGMSVTVEGVETSKHVDVLTEMDCDQFQGYYFARPMPAEQTLAVIRNLQAAADHTIQKSA